MVFFYFKGYYCSVNYPNAKQAPKNAFYSVNNCKTGTIENDVLGKVKPGTRTPGSDPGAEPESVLNDN